MWTEKKLLDFILNLLLLFNVLEFINVNVHFNIC